MPINQQDLRKEREDLKQQGFALFQYDNGPFHSYPYDAPWMTDATFSTLYDQIRGYTLVDRTRCYGLYQIMEQMKKVPGDALELGVWRGGTGALVAKVAPEKTVYLADTFTGVVKAAEWERYENGAHDDTNEVYVHHLFKQMGATNYKVLKGIFPEDTYAQLGDRPLAYVYLDADVYESTKDAFNAIWKQVSPGGIVAFDDYGFISGVEGIYKFVQEIKDDKDKLFIHNLNGQAYIVKR